MLNEVEHLAMLICTNYWKYLMVCKPDNATQGIDGVNVHQVGYMHS